MKSTERIMGLIGCALLGFCFILRTRRAKALRLPEPSHVEELAQDLKRAWAGYHTP